jgi:methyl-accepting chemotaxis protein
MTIDLDRMNRLAAMGIDDEARALLREIRPVLAANIDAAVEYGYSQMLKSPQVANVYTAASLIDAKRAQKSHWLEGILVGAFTEQQLTESLEIARKRQIGGLELRWFFVFFTSILDKLVEAAIFAYKKQPAKQAKIVSILTKVTQFDLEIFSIGYLDSINTAAAARVGGETDKFGATAQGLASELGAAAAQLQQTAQALAATARQATDEARAARNISENTGHNIDTVASATEELSSSIQEIARQVSTSTQIASAAVEEAKRTNAMVQGLAEAAGKIGDVVKLINNIASQTNLLALNATIEAARAGEAGKGFAVVAGEVKNLANQTAKATDEISAQIAAVQGATRDAVGAIQSIGTTIGKINEIASAIAAAVEEQGAATQEIARNVAQAAQSGASLVDNITSVSAAADNTNGAVNEVMGAANGLSQQAERLTSEVTKFQANIRAMY